MNSLLVTKVCESMAELKSSHHPIITFRPIRPSDLEVLEQLHRDLFPIRYEPEFFHNVVNGNDIVSWGVVDRSRPNYLGDQLIGFVTVKIVLAKESEISDLIRCDSSSVDRTLVYILTLGVVGSYRKLGIASALIKEVIKYASSIPTCRAVYLHVISYNAPAIHLYRKMSFMCVRCLYGFYLISGQQYDSYLFVYYVNGGKSPCSPLELVMLMFTYLRSAAKTVTARLWRNEEKKAWKSSKCKDGRCLMPLMQSKRNITSEDADYQCV
ncbi:hypothetical protein Droror1_Dr00009349 [Drosera rotundifolia]